MRIYASRRFAISVAATALLLAGGALGVAKSETLSFKGKAVTMIIGSAPGGGTDASGRIIATYLARYLPDQPTVIVRNVPGAEGMTAMNYVVQQVKPDGYTIVMGSASVADPMNYRRANALYDPAKFAIVGGIGRGGSVLLIARDALSKLGDHTATPAIMGSTEAMPRNGMQMTVWGIALLGWNARWVSGYPGTNEVLLALDRREIDMTATGNMFQIRKATNNGQASILYQSGSFERGKIAARPDLASVPIFSDAVRGKITDPLAEKAFKYWESISSMDKWVALPPGTQDDILAVYRTAFAKAAQDPDFLAQGKSISDDFVPQSSEDVDFLMKTLVATPTEATEYTKTLMRDQGLHVE